VFMSSLCSVGADIYESLCQPDYGAEVVLLDWRVSAFWWGVKAGRTIAGISPTVTAKVKHIITGSCSLAAPLIGT